MKTIIAGSRWFEDYDELKYIVDMIHGNTPITEVISGCARGADTLGEWWAKQNSILVKRFPAEWQRYGVSAGPIRNIQMADYVGSTGQLIAFLAPGSKGTKNMIEIAKRLNIKTTIDYLGNQPIKSEYKIPKGL